jgi:hypothetical protein
MAGACLVCAAQGCLVREATDEISLFCTPITCVCLICLIREETEKCLFNCAIGEAYYVQFVKLWRKSVKP